MRRVLGAVVPVVLSFAASGTAHASLKWSGPIAVDSGNQLADVSCPSHTQCTGVDELGREVTFNPLAGEVLNDTQVDPSGTRLLGVGCPSTRICATIDRHGHTLIFNPLRANSVTEVGEGIGGVAFTGSVSCPSVRQCTANYEGLLVTFDPTAPTKVALVDLPSSNPRVWISCPALHQCIGVWATPLHESAFDPLSTTALASTTIPGYFNPHDISCPSPHQCTTIAERPLDGEVLPGEEEALTFDPRSPLSPTAASVDSAVSLSCPTTRFCMAVNGGEIADEGSPPTTEWTHTVVGGAVGLQRIDCVSAGECVAVDEAGDAFVATPGPH
jgi:hypothetical protein